MKGYPPFEGQPESPLPPSATHPFELIQFALQHGYVQVVQFDKTVRRVRFVKREGERSALVLIDAPAGVGEDLQGPAEEKDFYLLIHIPREAADAFDEAATRRIILPGAG